MQWLLGFEPKDFESLLSVNLCLCTLVFVPWQNGEACGVALGEGFPCFMLPRSFAIHISEEKENACPYACPANACWCSSNRMEMPEAGVVAMGER